MLNLIEMLQAFPGELEKGVAPELEKIKRAEAELSRCKTALASLETEVRESESEADAAMRSADPQKGADLDKVARLRMRGPILAQGLPVIQKDVEDAEAALAEAKGAASAKYKSLIMQQIKSVDAGVVNLFRSLLRDVPTWKRSCTSFAHLHGLEVRGLDFTLAAHDLWGKLPGVIGIDRSGPQF